MVAGFQGNVERSPLGVYPVLPRSIQSSPLRMGSAVHRVVTLGENLPVAREYSPHQRIGRHSPHASACQLYSPCH